MNNSYKSDQGNDIGTSQQRKTMYRCNQITGNHTKADSEAVMYDHTFKSPLSTNDEKNTKPLSPRVRNGTCASTTITYSPRSVVPSKFVEHKSNNKYCKNHKNSCNGTESSCTNTIAKVTLKHPPKPQSPSTAVMADIPLRHSSYTRTLLPGLRRKNSIRRPTPRSPWEQILQNASFSFESTCSSSSSETTASSSSSSAPIIIKPPKHTQRILKYDPTTGNAYSNNSINNDCRSNDNSNSTSGCPHNAIMMSALGMIPRSKLSLSLWKMTLLVSFLYINLHLFHLQVEHHHISEVLASMVNIEPYQQLSPHFSHNHHRRLHPHRHRALRGTVTTSFEDYNSKHNVPPHRMIRGPKPSHDGNNDVVDSTPNQNLLAAPVEQVANVLPHVVSPPATEAAAATSMISSNDTNPMEIPATGLNTQETHQNQGEDKENEEETEEENEDSSNEPNDVFANENDEDDEETYILTSHEESAIQ